MKKSPKEIATEVKKRNAEEKKQNYSFRLKQKSMEIFQKKARSLGISYTDALQALIDSFNNG